MGHNPIPPRRLVHATGAASEALHLQRAREAYAHDLLDIDELERAIEHVLRGGYLDENYVLRAPIMDRVRRRRRQRDCTHDRVFEFMGTGDADPIQLICARCGPLDR